jgi:hypothetical protein
VLPVGCFLGPLGGVPPGGFDFPPFFCTPIAASADVIAASSIFICCIPAGPLDEEADAAVSDDPVISSAATCPYLWAPPCFCPPMFMADSYFTAAASAVSNDSVFPAMDSTAILMSFLIPHMNMHLMHSLQVSSCAAFSTSDAYFVLSFLSSPYHAFLHRSRKSFELSVYLCWRAAINLNFCIFVNNFVKTLDEERM